MSEKTDPRITRTRQALLQAFGALWAEKPLKSISIHDISHKAQVNRATFYDHFQDKYVLCDVFIKSQFESYLSTHLDPQAPLSQEHFRRLVQATLQFMVDLRRHRAYRQDIEDYVETSLQLSLFERLMTWIQPNYLTHGCEAGAEVAATAFSWAVLGVALRLAEQRKTAISVESVTNELVATLVMGLWNSLGKFQPAVLER